MSRHIYTVSSEKSDKAYENVRLTKRFNALFVLQIRGDRKGLVHPNVLEQLNSLLSRDRPIDKRDRIHVVAICQEALQ